MQRLIFTGNQQPTCSSDMDSNGVASKDACTSKAGHIRQSCILSYSGKDKPSLVWSRTDGKVVPPSAAIDNSATDKTIESILTVEAERSLDGVQFTCEAAIPKDYLPVGNGTPCKPDGFKIICKLRYLRPPLVMTSYSTFLFS